MLEIDAMFELVPNGSASAAQRVSRSAGVLALCGACHPTTDATLPARAPNAAQSEPLSAAAAPSSAAEAVAAPAGAFPALEGEGEFLVETPAHELVLRTRERVVRVLDTGVQNALYDPELELVWVEGESLRVVDLRKPDGKPITIVREWPGTSRLTISHPASTVSSNDACDVGDMATLEWSKKPTLKLIADVDRQLPLESKAWLKAELTRPAHHLRAPRATSIQNPDFHVALPQKLAHCQDPEECGNAVRFGAYDLELVLAVTLQGDCWHPYCVFHDPKSGVFSSPTLGKRWKGDGNRAGPCGLYYFDRSGKSFLEANRICDAGESCQDAGGYVLGWRAPGLVVGASGDGSMAPDAAELAKMDAERQQARERDESKDGPGD